jgi:hypothetical protein
LRADVSAPVLESRAAWNPHAGPVPTQWVAADRPVAQSDCEGCGVICTLDSRCLNPSCGAKRRAPPTPDRAPGPFLKGGPTRRHPTGVGAFVCRGRRIAAVVRGRPPRRAQPLDVVRTISRQPTAISVRWRSTIPRSRVPAPGLTLRQCLVSSPLHPSQPGGTTHRPSGTPTVCSSLPAEESDEQHQISWKAQWGAGGQ